jgi:hypothetical protein
LSLAVIQEGWSPNLSLAVIQEGRSPNLSLAVIQEGRSPNLSLSLAGVQTGLIFTIIFVWLLGTV